MKTIKKFFVLCWAIVAFSLLGAAQIRAVECTEEEIINSECFVSEPDGEYTVKIVKGDDGSFPRINEDGNSVFEYTIHCTSKIHDILALFEASDPPLEIINASTSNSESKYNFNEAGKGDTSGCKTYFGTGQTAFQTFEWTNFKANSGWIKVTIEGRVAGKRSSILLSKSCNWRKWEYGNIKLPARKPFFTLASANVIDKKTVTGLIGDPPNQTQVQINVEIYRDPITQCATKIRFEDLSGNWFEAEPITVFASAADDQFPEVLITCSSIDENQKCPECQFTATGSPGWTYIVSGGVPRRICIGHYVPGLGCCDTAGCIK